MLARILKCPIMSLYYQFFYGHCYKLKEKVKRMVFVQLALLLQCVIATFGARSLVGTNPGSALSFARAVKRIKFTRSLSIKLCKVQISIHNCCQLKIQATQYCSVQTMVASFLR